MSLEKSIEILRGLTALLATRRRGLFHFSLVLVFIALLPGSAAKPVQNPTPAMGGAAFPASVASTGGESNQADRGLFYSVHRVVKGDTIGDLAERFGVTTDSIVSFNDITNTRSIQAGRLLRIPSQAGILYKIKKEDSLDGVAQVYGISSDSIVEANGLMSERLAAGGTLFLPDARLPSFRLREINGDLFRWPVAGSISSRYGWRTDPFSGARSHHNGLDIAAWQGKPVYAAMEGRIRDTGYSPTFGNYILVSHHSGYSSFYGHLSQVAVKLGQSVSLNQRIGAVGSTGYSTGPHLHFTVFKNGVTVNPANLLH